MSVILVIKSATQTVEDFNLNCELSWTIGQVKNEIAELYPTKPIKESQKLIYGGKLLPDHLPLKSVLNHSNERHIMHLVCPSVTKTNNEAENKQATHTESFTVPPSSSTFPPMNQQDFNPQNLSGVPGINVSTINGGDAFQQYLAMQQMYAQFMTQYMSQVNGGVPPVISYGPIMSTPPVQIPQVPAPQPNVIRNPPQRPAEDDHDYLDYLYIFSRAVMLFAVLYYYSSMSRVLIVVTMFLCISMYVKLNRQHQQEMQRRTNERQRNESIATQPVPADIQTSESDEMPAPNPPSEDASLSQETENRSVLTVLTTTVNLISAFFSSLIPSDPVPVNVN